MKITEITVSYGATQSLPEYSNTKPSLTLTATLDEGDDAAAVEAGLWALVKAHVHEQIDLALEGSDKAAKYSDEPRYQVLRTYRSYHRPRDAAPEQLYVTILPNEAKIDGEQHMRWQSPSFHDTRKVRLGHARRMADEVVSQDGAILIDCTDGDLSKLAVAVPPQETAPEHLEDTLDYSERDQREEEEAAHYVGDDDENEDEDDDEEEEPRDFVVEAHNRQVERFWNKPSDDGPDNSE